MPGHSFVPAALSSSDCSCAGQPPFNYLSCVFFVSRVQLRRAATIRDSKPERKVYVEKVDMRAKKMARKAGALVMFVVRGGMGSQGHGGLANRRGDVLKPLAKAESARRHALFGHETPASELDRKFEWKSSLVKPLNLVSRMSSKSELEHADPIKMGF